MKKVELLSSHVEPIGSDIQSLSKAQLLVTKRPPLRMDSFGHPLKRICCVACVGTTQARARGSSSLKHSHTGQKILALNRAEHATATGRTPLGHTSTISISTFMEHKTSSRWFN